MTQLPLPLGWPADLRVSALPRTPTPLESLLSALASRDTLRDVWYDSMTSRFRERQQREFSGPSWCAPSYLWLGSPLQRRRRDGSPLFPTSPTTLVWRDWRLVIWPEFAERSSGILRPESLGNGDSLAAKSFPVWSSGVKPKYSF